MMGVFHKLSLPGGFSCEVNSSYDIPTTYMYLTVIKAGHSLYFVFYVLCCVEATWSLGRCSLVYKCRDRKMYSFIFGCASSSAACDEWNRGVRLLSLHVSQRSAFLVPQAF